MRKLRLLFITESRYKIDAFVNNDWNVVSRQCLARQTVVNHLQSNVSRYKPQNTVTVLRHFL